MRILAIRGCNLTSLAGDFEVDLSTPPLAQAGLFAITGTVGAGKSTLLDALCLALFDRTPRLADRGGAVVGRMDEATHMRLPAHDVRSLLRRGSTNGYAEVDFCGVDGQSYRSRWSVRRARDRSQGRLQEQSLELLSLDTQQRVAGNKKEVLAAIRERLGLSFDQFRRSVLLAQGEFAAFLHANGGERAELLERMTGTAIYGELSQAAHLRAGKEKQELELLQARQQEHHCLSLEERQQAQALLAQRNKELAGLRQELQVLQEAHRWHVERQRLEKERQLAQQSWQQASQQVQELQAQGQAAMQQLQGFLQQEQRDQAYMQASYQKEAESLQAWLDNKQDHRELVEQWPRWQKLLQRCLRAQEQLDQLEQSRLTAQDQSETAAEQSAQLAIQVASARLAWEQANGKKVAAANAMTSDLTTTLQDLRQQCKQGEQHLQLQQASQKATAASHVAKQNADAAKMALAQCEPSLKEAERAWQTAQRSLSLAEHRQHLLDGEPCPLCGALEHPYGEEQADSVTHALEARVQELRSQQHALLQQHAAANKEVQSQEQILHELNSQLSKQGQAVSAAELASLQQQLADDEAKYQQLQETMLLADKKADSLHQAWLGSQEQLRLLELDLQQQTKALEECQADMDLQSQSQQEAMAELEEVLNMRSAWQDKLQQDPGSFIEALAAEVQQFQQRSQELQTLQAQLASLLHEQKLLQSLVPDQLTSLQAACRVLAERKQAPPELLERLQAESQALQQRQAQLQQAQSQASHWQTLLQERERLLQAHLSQEPPGLDPAGLDPEMHLQAQMQVAQAAVESAASLHSEVRLQLRKDEDAQAEQKALQPKILKQQEACQIWQALKELIGSHDGKAFRVFAQSLSLDCLLVNANQHLQDLAPRYRLERVPDANMELQMVDLDMADERRSVRSLSGGESFLVSLALALGLSSLSAQSTRVESLFIDEGFGNLDAETLEVALASLDALQASGRQVGLVSHVAGMAEQMDVQVHLSKEAGGRSRLQVLHR